uniref:CCHC-type domain-containing protein n=1 Tax=Lactuca sativa TaxID=4236 RepID=A0A9R1X468_LACSA|nr:hypothetical protein LSAT_V11C700354480 [Lactuca sativa]
MLKSDGVTVDDLIGFLLQEEARIEHDHTRHAQLLPSTTTPRSSATGSSVFTANRSSSRLSSTSNLRSSTSSNRTGDTRRRRPLCQLCNRQGHEAIDCWQRNNQMDYLSRRPNPRDSSSQANVAQTAPSTVLDPAWYFDTRATDYVTPDIHKLQLA